MTTYGEGCTKCDDPHPGTLFLNEEQSLCLKCFSEQDPTHITDVENYDDKPGLTKEEFEAEQQREIEYRKSLSEDMSYDYMLGREELDDIKHAMDSRDRRRVGE